MQQLQAGDQRRISSTFSAGGTFQQEETAMGGVKRGEGRVDLSKGLHQDIGCLALRRRSSSKEGKRKRKYQNGIQTKMTL